jgi:hypothetical protein
LSKDSKDHTVDAFLSKDINHWLSRATIEQIRLKEAEEAKKRKSEVPAANEVYGMTRNQDWSTS